jgi:hypothetical protein
MSETLYELVVSGERKLFPLWRAAAVYDNGWIDVRFGTIVHENDQTRPMTDADRRLVADAADEYSASK